MTLSAAGSVPPADARLVAHGLLAALAGSDADRVLDVVDEDAPVAGLAGPRGADDLLHRSASPHASPRAASPAGTGLGLGRCAGGAGGWYSEPGTGMNCSG